MKLVSHILILPGFKDSSLCLHNGSCFGQAFDQAARDILRKIQQGVFDDRAVSHSS